MAKAAELGRTIAGFDPQKCVDFLRARHPQKTALCVAAAIGESERTVEGWLALKSQPRVRPFAKLVAAYGPAFVAAAIPGLAWVERAADLATYEGFSTEIRRIERQQAALAPKLFGAREEV